MKRAGTRCTLPAMHMASGIGESDELERALASACDELPAHADLVCVFAPAAWCGEPLTQALRSRFGSATLVGASASGLIGGGREVERARALSVTTATLPGARMAWIDPAAPVVPAGAAGVLLLADPFARVERLLEDLARASGAPVFGGIASGGAGPGSFRLIADDEVHRGGAIALAFAGPLRIDTLVAQGCKPVGEPMIVVRSEGNLVLEVDRGSPLDALRAVQRSLDDRDQRSLRQALFVGIQMRDQRGPYAPGDFLVRNVVGADPDRAALAVAAHIEGHPVIQFHLRDAEASSRDLERHLAAHAPGAAGALLFSCLGRGEGLFGVADHDADRIRARLFAERAKPHAPLGGFFCNGEVGPVGGQCFLHGYTASVAIFRPGPVDSV